MGTRNRREVTTWGNAGESRGNIRFRGGEPGTVQGMSRGQKWGCDRDVKAVKRRRGEMSS